MEPVTTGFKRRANRDGSFDSICLRCFNTAAIDYTEQALLAEESKHVCEPKFIRSYDWAAYQNITSPRIYR